MGICESKKNDKKENNSNKDEKIHRKIEKSDTSNSNIDIANEDKINFSQISENKKTNECDNKSNDRPKLEKYERSMAKKSEISHVQNGSDFSSKISEEEIIIKGEINKVCPNKEKDFNNNSFMRLVKNKGGIIIKEDAQSSTKNDNKNSKNNIFNEILKENISEIKSQISFQTNTKSKYSGFSLINGKTNKMDYQTEISKNKFSAHSMNQRKLVFNQSLKNEKKSYYSCKTNRPKINLNKYLNGIFNTENEINYQNYQCRNNEILNINQKYHNNGFFNKNTHDVHHNEKISLISNNNKSNESTNEDLMASFISIPQNDEMIPEYDLNFCENVEEIISNLSSEK